MGDVVLDMDRLMSALPLGGPQKGADCRRERDLLLVAHVGEVVGASHGQIRVRYLDGNFALVGPDQVPPQPPPPPFLFLQRWSFCFESLALLWKDQAVYVCYLQTANWHTKGCFALVPALGSGPDRMLRDSGFVGLIGGM